MTFLSQPLDRLSMSYVFIQRNGDGECELWHEQDQHGWYRADRLQQYSRQGQPDRLSAEGDQAEDAINAALEMVRYQRESVAELRNHVDWDDGVAQAIGDSQQERIVREGKEQPGQRPEPRRTDHQACEAEALLNGAGEQRADNAARTSTGKDDANRERAGVLALGQNDDDERIAYARYDQSARNERGEKDQFLTPQPDQPLFHLNPELLRCRAAFLLKLCANEEQRADGKCVRDRVGHERYNAGKGVQDAAECRTDHDGTGGQYLVLPRSHRELVFCYHVGQRRGLRHLEEDKERAFDQRDEVELDDIQPAERKGQWDAGERDCSARVAEDHHQLAVPAIDQRARRETEQGVWQAAQRRDQASLRRGVGQRQDQEWEGEL